MKKNVTAAAFARRGCYRRDKRLSTEKYKTFPLFLLPKIAGNACVR